MFLVVQERRCRFLQQSTLKAQISLPKPHIEIPYAMREQLPSRAEHNVHMRLALEEGSTGEEQAREGRAHAEIEYDK